MQTKINVVGLGSDGIDSLTPEKVRLIVDSDILMGWKSHLEMFESIPLKKVLLGGNLKDVLKELRRCKGKQVTILAGGDPNFFGITEFLYAHMEKEHITVYPHVSSMQLAFAAVKESMNHAKIVSVHGRSLEDLEDPILNGGKVGIFTDAKNTPAEVAKFFISIGATDFTMFLCENLGLKSEKVRKMSLKSLSRVNAANPNILVCIRDKKRARKRYPFGIPDEEFYFRDNMITKEEVRVVALSKLRLRPESIVWDIGAGSGSISIEAALIAYKGHVYAIEKDAKGCGIIVKNSKKFSVNNFSLIQEIAPKGLSSLPAPDAVFIGGSSGGLKTIIGKVLKRLKPGGRIVFNTLILENLHQGVTALREFGLSHETVQVQICKEKEVGSVTLLSGQNPIFVVSATQKL